MGVDFSHGDLHFSYVNFNRFRRKLALEIGVDAGEMEGFGGSKSWESIDDPIVPLLAACDSNGEIAAHDCPFVSKRLLEIVAESPEDDALYWKERAMQLVEALQIAAEREEKFHIG